MPAPINKPEASNAKLAGSGALALPAPVNDRSIPRLLLLPI